MSKAFLLIPTLLFALPSCDSAHGDHHGEKAATDNKVSTAIVQIVPSSLVLADPAIRTENFIANEIASISMGDVIEMAYRNEGWAKKSVDLNRIKNTLKVTRIEGTDMAKITAISSANIPGKDIINGVVTSYLQIRHDIEKGATESALRALDNELIAQSDLVHDLRKELMVLIQQYGFPYFDQSPNPLGKAEVEIFTQTRKELAALEAKTVKTKAQLNIAGKDEITRKKLVDKIELMESQLQALSKIAVKRQEETIELSLKQSNFTIAKSRYEIAMELLHQMKVKQQESRIAHQMPIHPLIFRQKPN